MISLRPSLGVAYKTAQRRLFVFPPLRRAEGIISGGIILLKKMKKNRIYTIPNLLSLYRLLMFPYILYLSISGQEQLFSILLIINLITDVLDGLIARCFNLQTELGARLDSIGDFGTYIAAITGIFIFKVSDFQPYWSSFFIFIFLLCFAHILSLIKFGRLPSLHLYSWKIGGYIQGAFFIVLFLFGFYPLFYYIMIIWGILEFCEHIIIQMIIKEMRSNAKGLYWILKNKMR
jgi:CDP-diacylglycerol--glycerol-3-phosphate 3-phosphatidyltransferase